MIVKYYSERERKHLEAQCRGLPGVILRYGGPGSGNFGHEGRPGERGGSGSGGGSPSKVGGGTHFEPTIAHESAIRKYSGMMSSQINKPLREGRLPSHPKEREMVRLLDDYTKNAELINKPLFRGVSFTNTPDFKPGMVYSDAAFQSFTQSETLAQRFARKFDNAQAVVFHCPTDGAPSIAHLAQVPDEQEAIFPRGQRFKILNVTNVGTIKYVRIKPL